MFENETKDEEEESLNLFVITPSEKVKNTIGYLIKIDEDGKFERLEHKETDDPLDSFEIIHRLIGGLTCQIPRITTQCPFHAWGLLDAHWTDNPNNYKAGEILRHLKFHVPWGIKGKVVILSDKDKGMSKEYADDLERIAKQLPTQLLEDFKSSSKAPPTKKPKKSGTKTASKTKEPKSKTPRKPRTKKPKDIKP